MGAAAARRDKRCDGARSGAAPDPKGPTMLHRRLTGLAVTAGLLAFAAPASAAPPGNDNFENAAPLGQPVAQVTGTVDEATRQEGEPVHGVQSVWYAFQPSTTQRVAAEIAKTNNSSLVATVYTGSSVSSLRRVGASGPGVSRVPFDAQAGERYWIAVSYAYDETSGSQFQLRVRPAPLPANATSPRPAASPSPAATRATLPTRRPSWASPRTRTARVPLTAS